jgi:tol-pal system protein YbgF
VFSCAATTYRDEIQTEIDSLKTSSKNIDDRYNNKYELLSEKLKALTANVKDIEKSLSQNKADTEVSFDDLRTELQSLKGAVEESVHKVSILENSTNKSVSELDSRVAELENKFNIILASLSKLQSILEGDGKSSQESKSGSGELSEYDAIYKIISQDKNYDLALDKLKKFILKYPASSLADNAQYWIGECLYAKGQFRSATQEFDKLIEKYPSSDKKCGALLKQGLALAELKDGETSKKVLKDVLKSCPESSEAKVAQERLGITSEAPKKDKPSSKKTPR